MNQLAATEARALMGSQDMDSMMALVFNRIRAQARENRNFVTLTDKDIPGAAKWGKMCHDWSGMGIVTEFKNMVAQPFVNELKELGYQISYAHSQADGPHPEWWGIRVEW
jgi:hypothetical protein